MEDEKIVELFLLRDEKAIGLTGTKYGGSLRKIALNICGNLSDAEECENDTYLAAWNSIPPHEPRRYFFPYLAKIVRAKALNKVREETAQKRSAQLTELSDELESCLPGKENVEETVDAKVLSGAVSDFLRTQSEEKRNIFIRRYFFLDSVSDIAERTGISEGKVKTVLFRTRAALKDYLRKEGWNI